MKDLHIPYNDIVSSPIRTEFLRTLLRLEGRLWILEKQICNATQQEDSDLDTFLKRQSTWMVKIKQVGNPNGLSPWLDAANPQLRSKSRTFSYTKYKSVATQKVKILQYSLWSWTVDINVVKEECASCKAKFNKRGISKFTLHRKHPIHEHVMCTAENDAWRMQLYKTDTAQWCNYRLPHQHIPLHTRVKKS